jgi:hypothetical protein
VAGCLPIVSAQLGIVELAGACATMRARSLALFSVLGGWVTATEPGELQRLFAEACHRHAWHAELWEARTPTIPLTPKATPEPAGLGDADGDDLRRDRYRVELSSLEDELRALRARVDPALDPGTARTIDLVGRDVVEIADRLDALRAR